MKTIHWVLFFFFLFFFAIWVVLWDRIAYTTDRIAHTTYRIAHTIDRIAYTIDRVAHTTDGIAHTSAFVTPTVVLWLDWKIAQWVHNEGLIQRPIAEWENVLTQSYMLLPHFLKNASIPCTGRTLLHMISCIYHSTMILFFLGVLHIYFIGCHGLSVHWTRRLCGVWDTRWQCWKTSCHTA